MISCNFPYKCYNVLRPINALAHSLQEGLLMQIYFLPITDPTINYADSRLLQLTSQVRRERVLKYRSDLDKKLSLYAEAVSRMGFSQATGVPAWDLEFCYREQHKPTVKNAPDYDFSYSHTRSAILCAITEAGKIGADIEGLREAPYNIMKKVFHADEIEYAENGNPSLKNQRFFEIWTRKEAYTKYLGIGLTTKLSEINTLSPDLTPHFKTWRQNEYVCSVFSDKEYCEPQILTEETVYQYLTAALAPCQDMLTFLPHRV